MWVIYGLVALTFDIGSLLTFDLAFSQQFAERNLKLNAKVRTRPKFNLTLD